MKENKCQEALNYFLDREEGENITVTIDWLENAETLQELVAKETPMKPRFENGVYKCDLCNENLRNDYIKCPTCGQRIFLAIDWSKDNE